MKPECTHEETALFCTMCGKEATGDMLDYGYCPDCKDHTTFDYVCANCDEVVGEYYDSPINGAQMIPVGAK